MSVAPIIAFLDFDGVISSPRAFIVNEGMDHDHRWMDPVSLKLIGKLQRDYGFQLVISSTWRGIGRPRLEAILAPYGLDSALHDDYRTGEDEDRNRSVEINDWLNRHGWPEYIILDDDGFEWSDEQRSRWVQSCSFNGFLLANYEQADKLLKTIRQHNAPETPA